MGSKRYGLLINALVAGCAALFCSGGLLYSAGPAPGDPFAALRMSRVEAGGETAAFNLKALNGQTLRSQDLAGKVVLLNFWATWCGPCKEEMPSLARLQTHFDPDRVRIVTVTADMYPQGIKQFLDQLGVSLPVGFDEDQEVTRTFLVRGLPTTIVIGQDGRTVGRAVGPRVWDSPESIALVRQVLGDIP
jgi:thiol-disulfide isomerase/thioredoxin